MRNLLLSFFSLLLIGGPTACQQPDSASSSDKLQLEGLEETSQKIFGGRPVSGDSNVLPFMVSLRSVNQAGDLVECTGTLIHPEFVLTAAHCVENTPEVLDSIRLQFLSTTTEPGDDTLIRRAIHVELPEVWEALVESNPESLAMLPFDVAVIQLDYAAPHGTRPVKFADEGLDISEIPKFVAVGFGAESATIYVDAENRWVTPEGQGILRMVELERSSRPHFHTQIEVRQFSKGICFGDSGAPALIQQNGEWLQIGVSSFVRSLGELGCRDSGSFINLGFEIPLPFSESFISRYKWIEGVIDRRETKPMRVPPTPRKRSDRVSEAHR